MVVGAAPTMVVTCTQEVVEPSDDAAAWMQQTLALCRWPEDVDVIVFRYDTLSEGDLLQIGREGILGDQRWTNNLHAHNVPAAVRALTTMGKAKAVMLTATGVTEAVAAMLTAAPQFVRLVVDLPTRVEAAELKRVIDAAHKDVIVAVTGRSGSTRGIKDEAVVRRSEIAEELRAEPEASENDPSYYYMDEVTWMGGIAMLLFAILLSISVHCLMGLQVPTQFDHPKTKYAIQIGLVEND